MSDTLTSICTAVGKHSLLKEAIVHGACLLYTEPGHSCLKCLRAAKKMEDRNRQMSLNRDADTDNLNQNAKAPGAETPRAHKDKIHEYRRTSI